jgi:hypothetical protein
LGLLFTHYARPHTKIPTLPAGTLSLPADAQTTTVFTDRAAGADFRRFHRVNARVAIVDMQARGGKIREPVRWLEF